MGIVRRWIPYAPLLVLSIVAVVSIATMTPAVPAPPAPRETSALTVVQWNVCGDRSGCPSSARPEAITAAVAAEMVATDADAALLQETCAEQAADVEELLEGETGRGWTARFAPILLKRTDDPDTAPAKRCAGGDEYGIAMILPAESTWWKVVRLSSPDGAEWRAAMCATIPSRGVKLCNAHLTSPGEDDGDAFRSRQVAEYLEFALPSEHRVVVGGDLNLLPPGEADYDGDGVDPLYDRLVECEQRDRRSPRTGPGTYFREDGAAEKVDYLFTDVGRGHECGDGREPSPVSDHRPMSITVRLPVDPRG